MFVFFFRCLILKFKLLQATFLHEKVLNYHCNHRRKLLLLLLERE